MITLPATLIALSPHPDDVALSAAGAVLSWPGPCTLATVFCADRTVPASGGAFGMTANAAADLMARRRDEDSAACEILGCEPAQLGLEDALGRALASGEAVMEAAAWVFDGDASAEPDVLEAATQALRELIDGVPEPALLAPAGFGGHRDHAIARRAAEQAGAPIFAFYEDQPYGWRKRGQTPSPPAHFQRRTLALEPATWERKLRSLACHDSQMSILWGAHWRDEVAAEHARADGVPIETLWELHDARP
jgi:LmbE family N-acetylglucosaminyl deacetylase